MTVSAAPLSSIELIVFQSATVLVHPHSSHHVVFWSQQAAVLSALETQCALPAQPQPADRQSWQLAGEQRETFSS